MGPSPSTAVAVLELFARGKWALTQEEYDALFDTVLEFLETVNDEKHRITPRSE